MSTTIRIGEEEPLDTTHAIGEEEYDTTHAIGEEDFASTDALGEEEPYDEPASTGNPFGDF